MRADFPRGLPACCRKVHRPMIKLAFAPPKAKELDMQTRIFSGTRSLLPTKCSGARFAFGMPSHTCTGDFGAEPVGFAFSVIATHSGARPRRCVPPSLAGCPYCRRTVHLPMIKLAFAPPKANELDMQILTFSGVRSLLLPTKCSGMSSAFGMPSHACAGWFGAGRLHAPVDVCRLPTRPARLLPESSPTEN